MKLLMLILSATVLSADPVAITWTGTPEVSGYSCPGCGNGTTYASFTSGLTATLNVSGPGTFAEAVGDQSAFDVSNQFTLDAPALIDVTAALTYNVYAAACPASGCSYGLTAFDLTGQFSGELVIVGGGNALVIPLGASGDTEIPCNDGCGTGTLDLSDTESGSVLLDAGTYTVMAWEYDSTNAGGDSMTGSGLRATLTDPSVPEPQGAAYFLMLIAICCKIRKLMV